MRLMFSELEDAKRILKDGFTDGYKWSEALAVAKYYRHVFGYGDARVKTEITKFCESNDKNFYPVPRRWTIKSLVKNSSYDFRDTTKQINITKKEIEKIKKIKNFKYQSILIGLLVISKLYDRSYVKIEEWKIIRKIISKYISNKEIKNCITEAYKNELIGENITDRHVLLFINNESSLEMVLKTDKDIYSLGKQYEELCGGILEYCSICGNEFIKKGKQHRYCKKHSEEKKKENNLKRFRRYVGKTN